MRRIYWDGSVALTESRDDRGTVRVRYRNGDLEGVEIGLDNGDQDVQLSMAAIRGLRDLQRRHSGMDPGEVALSYEIFRAMNRRNERPMVIGPNPDNPIDPNA